MPIASTDLFAAAQRFTTPEMRSLQEAKSRGAQTVFLCHSHADQEFVKGIIQMLREAGWQAYVDWNDTTLPDTPTRTTAARIKQRIVELNYFMFLATRNSMSSRWCPWEIGYADGKKPMDKILVVPTSDSYGTHGSEYLQLYRHADFSREGRLAVWEPGETSGVRIETLR